MPTPYLGCWNLTLPYSEPGTTTPLTIPSPQLCSGYGDECFTSSDDALSFRAYDGGVTTVNSSYPRCELREADSEGNIFNWKMGDSSHYLTAAVTVTSVPHTEMIILGQVHVKNSNGPLCKIIYRKGALWLKYRPSFGSVESSVILLPELGLGERFTYGIKVSARGGLFVWVGKSVEGSYKTEEYTLVLDSSWCEQLLYFKAGVYSSSSLVEEVTESKAIFHKLAIRH